MRSGNELRFASSGGLISADVKTRCVGNREPVRWNLTNQRIRELEDSTFLGAAPAVDSVEMALREAGDVIMALKTEHFRAAKASCLFLRSSSTADAQRTIFKSVGTAGEDLVTGELLMSVFAEYREC